MPDKYEYGATHYSAADNVNYPAGELPPPTPGQSNPGDGPSRKIDAVQWSPTAFIWKLAPKWRVGRGKQSQVFKDDKYVGTMDTNEAAEEVVEAMNVTDVRGDHADVDRALHESRMEAGRDRWDVADAMEALEPFMKKEPGWRQRRKDRKVEKAVVPPTNGPDTER